MKIFAVGMNYAEHNKELKNTLLITETDQRTEEPVIFTKADSALLKDGKPFFVPDFMGRIDYETELVVRICRLGKGIPTRFAYRYYDAVTVGIDFTARDVQRRAKELGRPWTIAKGFDGSAVIGEWVALPPLKVSEESREAVEERRRLMGDLHFHLEVNGTTVQQGWSGDMLYSVDELISYVSRFFTLKTGDLLYTGTPVGVGPVQVNDHLEGFLGERKVLEFNCK